MGLLVHTSFETPNGILITNVYVRISSIAVQFGGETAQVTIKCESYVSREKRVQRREPLFVPKIPTYYIVDTPLDSGWNDMASLYSSVKSQMITDGFETIEDIDPDNDPVPVLTVVDPSAETPPS
jgi:hypothetical protein